MLILRAIFQKHRITFLSPWGTGRSKPDVQKCIMSCQRRKPKTYFVLAGNLTPGQLPALFFFHSNSSCLHSVCCLGVLLKGWEALFVFSENGTLPETEGQGRFCTGCRLDLASQGEREHGEGRAVNWNSHWEAASTGFYSKD